MTIPFTNIPANTRVPFFYVEIDPSHANSFSGINQRALILGQKTAAGVGIANTARIVEGLGDAISQGGLGSMFALMVDRYRQSDPDGELWGICLDDDGAAVAAVGAILGTHVATADGTLSLYVGDVRVSVLVTASMTLAQIATALIAAVNANVNLPVTAAVDGVVPAQVNITAKNKGAAQNDIALQFNLGGAPAGEQLPTGYTATITAMTGGATNPSLTTALANLMDEPFDCVIIPYFDTTSLDSLKSFFSDATGRWSFNRQVFGHGFTSMKGTLGAATTLGAARNDQHVTILPENSAASPHWLWSPSYAASAFRALRADPGRPVQTLAVNGIRAPAIVNRFAWSDQNALLFSGMSTYSVANDGTVLLQNLITTYQKNGFGVADDSYLEIETLFQLMFLLRDLRAFVTSTFSRFKLAKNGTRFAPGAAVVTPDQIKAAIISRYEALEALGYCQDSATFAKLIIVEQNAQNPNRVDVLWPAELMDQLRIVAVLAQFRL